MSDVQGTAAPSASAESTAPVVDANTESLDLDAAEAELESSSGEGEISADVINQAQKDGKITKQEAASLKKQLKIKIDGKEETVEYDPNDEEALKREFQKSRAFDKRAKEFATLKNNVDSLVNRLIKGDESAEQALRDLGMNPEDFAEKLMMRKIKELEKSPEQVKQEQMEKELAELKAEKKRLEEENSQKEMEKLRNQYAAEIENEITTALDASDILPKKNARVVKRIAQTMHSVLSMKDDKGGALYPDVTIKDIIPIVEREWEEEYHSMFDSASEEVIERLVKKENFDRVRKKRLANRPKAPVQTSSSIRDTGAQKGNQQAEKPKKTMKSFFGED